MKIKCHVFMAHTILLSVVVFIVVVCCWTYCALQWMLLRVCSPLLGSKTTSPAVARLIHSPRVPKRIKFNLTELVCKCIHGTAPSYLCRVTDNHSRQWLWSASSTSLCSSLASFYHQRPLFPSSSGSQLERTTFMSSHTPSSFKTHLTGLLIHWLFTGSQGRI